jgi:hypothetical protein
MVVQPLPDPSELARHYARVWVGERLLLTGHAHQAWPHVGLEVQQRAWLDAAEHVDEKWARAFEAAERVRAGCRCSASSASTWTSMLDRVVLLAGSPSPLAGTGSRNARRTG